MTGIRCWIISRRLQEYLDGELSDRSRQIVQKHVAGCDACRHLLDDYKAQVEVASSIRLLEPPNNFTSNVMSRLELIEARHPARDPVRSFSLAHAGWVAAGFTVLAIALGYWVNNPQGVPVTSTTRPEQPRISNQYVSPPTVATETQPPPAPVVEKETTKPANTLAVEIKPVRNKRNESLYASNRLRSYITEKPHTALASTSKSNPVATPDTTVATDPKVILNEAINSENEGRLDEALAAYEAVASNTSDPHTAFLGKYGRGRIYEKMGMTVTAVLAYDDALNSSGGNALPDGSN